MKTTEQGQAAERAVAEKLRSAGYEILAKNWKTKVCEIDLIAKKTGVIYFVEVKYRRQPAQGDGFEYITAQKQRKMEFAAKIWLQHHNWNGDYRLAAAAVSGQNCELISVTEL